MINFFFSCVVIFLSIETFANNAFYISISNQVARKQGMEVSANNAANVNTIGYEQDASLFRAAPAGVANFEHNQFVEVRGLYKTGDLGPLKTTNRSLDISVSENHQYLKLMTPKGPRYTLSGSFFRASNGVISDSSGNHLLSQNDDVLEIPENISDLKVLENGSILADGEEIGKIGVHYVADRNTLIKEGTSLYKSNQNTIALDDYTIISGALRASNVNSAQVIAEVMEAQRSFSSATSLLSEIGELEKQAVGKIIKP
ncbi:MAG: flagellar hook basal-body protein [Rickettsiaceae bacterium]|nr:flagellar hook basal-body protein [Rickettsiaceae bacterium]